LVLAAAVTVMARCWMVPVLLDWKVTA